MAVLFTVAKVWKQPECPSADEWIKKEVACVCVCLYIHMLFFCLVGKSYFNFFVTPWTVARQAPLSLGFPRQEYWIGLTFPSPGGLPNPGIEASCPALAGGFFITERMYRASLVAQGL